MKARITLNPQLLRRLMDGKPLQFKLSKSATEVEIVIEEDVFDRIERTFDKLWNKVLDKIDKLAE